MVFIVWMVVFDANSWLIHNDLNDDIEDLILKLNFIIVRFKRSKRNQHLNSPDGIEKYAREHYKMKKENEVVYIIEDADSLKVKTNE